VSGPDLQALADREAIRALIHRYCRAVDRLDPALGYSVWHADGEADYGATYQGSGRGLIDFVIAQHRQCLRTSHQVTNILIELDGAQAVSEAYHFAAIRLERDGRPQQIDVRGRYLDRWSRRDGVWGIDRRVTVRDFAESRPVTPLDDDPRVGRDGTDLSDPLFRRSAREPAKAGERPC
jgi:hypothetical protein